MKVRKVDNKSFLEPLPDTIVKLTEAGNIFEITTKNNDIKSPITKISKDLYILNATGELCEFRHENKVRAQDLTSVSQSLKRLRSIINANITEPENALWVTLTYAENMTDSKRLYEDFRRFNQKFFYYNDKNNLPKYNYIVTAEPQGRGAWHMHLLIIYECKAPFIANDTIAGIWGRGFTKTKAIINVDNVGAYLSAYLADISIEEAIGNQNLTRNMIIKEVPDGKNSKHFLKGARLRLYPKGFRLYRTSRGVKRPMVSECTYAQALGVIGEAPMCFEKTIELLNGEDKVFNIINYKQYNKKLKRGRINEYTANYEH